MFIYLPIRYVTSSKCGSYEISYSLDTDVSYLWSTYYSGIICNHRLTHNFFNSIFKIWPLMPIHRANRIFISSNKMCTAFKNVKLISATNITFSRKLQSIDVGLLRLYITLNSIYFSRIKFPSLAQKFMWHHFLNAQRK